MEALNEPPAPATAGSSYAGPAAQRAAVPPPAVGGNNSAHPHPLQQLMSRLGVTADMTPAEIVMRGVALRQAPPAPDDAAGGGGGSGGGEGDGGYEYDEAYFYGAPFAGGGSAWGTNVMGNAALAAGGQPAAQPASRWTPSNVLASGNLVHHSGDTGGDAEANQVEAASARKLCPFFMHQGHCKYGDFCRYRHELPAASAQPVPGAASTTAAAAVVEPVGGPIAPDPGTPTEAAAAAAAAATAAIAMEQAQRQQQKQQSQGGPGSSSAGAGDGDLCTICLERPEDVFRRYGVLPACEHVFCLPCIRAWRRNHGATARGRDCPVCRRTSFFVIPSFSFVCAGPAKDLLLHSYHKSMKAIPCKLFQTTGKCQFGSSCFYRHVDQDGNEAAPETVRVRVGVGGFTEPAAKFTLADYIKKR